MEIPKQPTNHILDKVSRFKPVAFIRKNLFVTIVILLIIVTNLVGIWNIKKYEIYDISGAEIPPNILNDISKYIEENSVGENFFLLSPSELNNQLVSNISYIKNVDVKKSLPNKLEIFVEIYQPELLSVLNGGQCYVLSTEGIMLERVCEGETRDCCMGYIETNKLYLLTSSSVDISKLENGKEKLLVMESISKVTKVTKSLGYNIKSVTLSGDILELQTIDGKILRFSLGEDLDTQLERLVIVAGKIKSDKIKFKSLDVRFERPVIKN